MRKGQELQVLEYKTSIKILNFNKGSRKCSLRYYKMTNVISADPLDFFRILKYSRLRLAGYVARTVGKKNTGLEDHDERKTTGRIFEKWVVRMESTWK